jgi:hypothetical protein
MPSRTTIVRGRQKVAPVRKRATSMQWNFPNWRTMTQCAFQAI